MRVLAAALAVLLLVAICSLAQADLRVSRNAEFYKRALTETELASCCLTYVSRRIPRRVIHSAYWTSSSCPKQAVVLVTRKGRQICVDPEVHWVQEYLEHLELLKD